MSKVGIEGSSNAEEINQDRIRDFRHPTYPRAK